MSNWIDETIKDLQERKAYGRVTLHMEHGNVTRINVEQSVLPPKKELDRKEKTR